MPGSVRRFFHKTASSLKNALTRKNKADKSGEDSFSLWSDEPIQSYRERCNSDVGVYRKKEIPKVQSRCVSTEGLDKQEVTNFEPDNDEGNVRRCWSEDYLHKDSKKKPFFSKLLCGIPEVDSIDERYMPRSKPPKCPVDDFLSMTTQNANEFSSEIFESLDDPNDKRAPEKVQGTSCEATEAKPLHFKDPATSSGISSLQPSLPDEEGPMMKEFMDAALANTPKGHSASTPQVDRCKRNTDTPNKQEIIVDGERLKHAQSLANITATGNTQINFMDGNTSDALSSPSAILAVNTSIQKTDVDKLQDKTRVQLKSLACRQKVTERSAFRKATERLTNLKESRIVVLVSYSGDGKTVTGKHLLRNTEAFNKTLLIRSVHEWGKLAIKEKAFPDTLVFIDNFFGADHFNKKLFQDWQPVMDEIYSACTDGNISLIIAIDKKVFVQYLKHYRRHQLFAQKFILDLSKEYKLSETEKIRLIEEQLESVPYAKDVKICDDEETDNTAIFRKNEILYIWRGKLDQIANMNYPIGFPRAVERFVSSMENIRLGVDFFLKPVDEIVDAINRIRRNALNNPYDKQIYFAIGTLLLSRGNLHLDAEDLACSSFFPCKRNSSRQTRTKNALKHCSLKDSLCRSLPNETDSILYLKQGIDEILGNYLERDGDNVYFHCVSVHYSAAVSYGKSFPKDIIEVMPIDFVQKFVEPSKASTDEDSLHIELNQNLYEPLAVRLMKEIEAKNVKKAMDNIFWGEKAFVSFFLHYIEREAKMKILLQTQDKDTGLTVVCYGMEMAFRKSPDFSNFTEQVIKTGKWKKHMRTCSNQLKVKQEKRCLKIAIEKRSFSTVQTLLEVMRSIDEDCFDSVIKSGCTKLLSIVYKYPTYRIDVGRALIRTSFYHYGTDPAMAMKFSKALLSKEQDVIVKSHFRKALFLAVEANDANSLKMLQALGADINIQFGDRNLLYQACMKGHTECVDVLIKGEVDTSLQTHNGSTALHISIEQGHYDIATILIKHNRDLLDVTDLNNRQPLHIAVSKSDVNSEFIEQMIDNSANMDAKDKHRKTPLDLAISAKNWHVVEVLTQSRINLTITNCNDQ